MRILFSIWCMLLSLAAASQAVIRYNQLGYTTQSPKILVAGSKDAGFVIRQAYIENLFTAQRLQVSAVNISADFGAYGPFVHSYRIDLTNITAPGSYRLVINDSIESGVIRIGDAVYKGSADFCLRYMRQQRSGFNPFLKDSCHTQDGYVMYSNDAFLPDSTHVDVAGGWHDASDYLQYTTTTANAAYHLLMAYRDNPHAFGDTKQANGLNGKNGIADVLDEAKWGLDWLLKMHPEPNYMFSQLGDDRDHISMRIPKEDSQYGKGYERPVYFLTGEPQGLGKYKNKTAGTSSIAAKFSSAFALGSNVFLRSNKSYATLLGSKALSALDYANLKRGFTNTAPNRAPYYYEESNWVDDMELAYAAMYNGLDSVLSNMENGSNSHTAMMADLLDSSFAFAQAEPNTPWLGADTARHYEWYPFINVGHYELAKLLDEKRRKTILHFYRQGIEKVWTKAKQNAFYRGVPFIWCSNNLTVSFAMQCLWYRELSGDSRFRALEQANIDWLFGCNPWGTSMVYGLPAWGDTPEDPHSAFTHLKNYPIDGGLVDGPVYTSIFKNLIGLTLYQPDEYAEWQSDLAVYHDDYGDYSTNEPTMDGTASLIYLLAAQEKNEGGQKQEVPPAKASPITYQQGAMVRGDSTVPAITLVFTGHEFTESAASILATLKQEGVPAAFFLTGDCINANPALAKQIVAQGHYLGAHSNKHLLYAPWTNRDSLLVTQAVFQQDLLDNYAALAMIGVAAHQAPYFLPPYEWYNNKIASWTDELGLQLINHTGGTLSAADYTLNTDKNFRSNDAILQSILAQANKPGGLNGYLLLMHIGAGKGRSEKFADRLPDLIETLKGGGYRMVSISEMLHQYSKLMQ